MDFKFRIEQADISQIGTLIKWRKTVLSEVFSTPESELPEALIEQNRLYFEREIPKGGNLTCFVYYKDEIIGCGSVCLYDEMPSPDNLFGKCAYLMNIYTVPEYRGRGVGSAVVGWLVGGAKERGYFKIYLETSDAGKPLYKKLGFEDMRGLMKL